MALEGAEGGGMIFGISRDGRVPRGSSASEVSGAKVIKIPTWLWEKKEAVKPMGAPR